MIRHELNEFRNGARIARRIEGGFEVCGKFFDGGAAGALEFVLKIAVTGAFEIGKVAELLEISVNAIKQKNRCHGNNERNGRTNQPGSVEKIGDDDDDKERHGDGGIATHCAGAGTVYAAGEIEDQR